MPHSRQAFSAPSKQMPGSNPKGDLNSTASISVSSTISIPSSEQSASKPRDSTLKREQNPRYRHDNGLISALLDQICQHRREITFIIARLAFECVVNLRYLIKFADDPAVFDSYIAYSLRQEKRLYDKIGNDISASGGKELPVHTRMLNSIAKAVKASGARMENLS